ncbi:MAG: ATP-binding cassette domain-containing protein [Chitinophagaceae bacterium]|nr:MAG: ATP-binding cassette domain-containing protein [Chitinophagaceae bacterium]
MNQHVLEADSMQLCFGDRRILSDVFLRCRTGTVTGLLGRNGQGKSCLLQLIFGTRAGECSVRVDGTHLPQAFRRPDLLRYLPQHHFIPAGFRVATVFGHYGLAPGPFLERFALGTDRLRARLRDLSGGERRLVELYVISAAPTQFVLLDEPFTHLGPLQVELFKEWLPELKREKGILLSDHLFRHVLDCSDELYVLKDGKTHLAKSEEDIERLGYARL